ncbi:DUF899 domain-containing protein [Pseudaminobacter soli (ex Li et al. 2025)]|uniref:DUF899 domain-containing protein n=1 Tax=Pseudaminobacter soli (ex Li et al. 2025) TaxID=1295366 RepID=UPI002476CC53|nr:thioredoxin family protein [Mesorhizobium soli]
MREIVSREDWLAARKALLAREREVTHMQDQLSAERRALPWVHVDKDYRFDTPGGQATLDDLFEGRSQLIVYHFMLTPGSEHICEGCAFVSDHVDAARQHFEHNDLSFVAISRVPLDRIEAVRGRMGWKFNWVSSANSSFNFDFGVSFTKEQVASGDVGYNFGTTRFAHEDLHGLSVFAREGGEVFHTYSTYARGVDVLLGAHNFLDLTPKGRNEKGTMDWVRLHDEYENAPAVHASCG